MMIEKILDPDLSLLMIEKIRSSAAHVNNMLKKEFTLILSQVVNIFMFVMIGLGRGDMQEKKVIIWQLPK